MKCVAAAGYSVGEISALVFAGAYTFEEGCSYIILQLFLFLVFCSRG